MKETKKQWEEDVITLLTKLEKRGSLVEGFEISRLLSVHAKLQERAELKRQNSQKRASIRKIQGTELIKVNKRDNERLKELLSEAVKLI